MTKPSLSAIYRQATARRDSGIAADDVARLAAGETLGQRHDAAVEALAGSAAALVAFRAAQAVAGDARAFEAQASTVVALPVRRAAGLRPALAMAAGVMGLALVAGLLQRLDPGAPTGGAPVAAAGGDDVIFGVSYEGEGAIASRDEAIFVDEFGG
jgi:hypothetical protein